MPQPRHTMSETCEHVFEKVMWCKRENYVQEFVEIVENCKDNGQQCVRVSVSKEGLLKRVADQFIRTSC